jgi:Tfp pilus assembly protein PilF
MGGTPMQMNSIEEAFEKMDAPITAMIQRLTSGTGARTAAASEGPNKEAVSHLEKGIIFFDRNDYDLALAEFTEAIRIDQNYAKAYAWRARIYADKGANDTAIADAAQALRIDPNDALAKQGLEIAQKRGR